MKKKFIFILLGLVVLGGAAYWYFRSGKSTAKVSLATVKPQYGYIARSVTATGTVEPVDTVSVGAQVSGVVKKVYADFNSTVKQGQLLAEVDPSIMEAQVLEAKASLASVQSNFQYQQSNFDRQTQLFNMGAISKAEFQLAQNQFNSAKASISNAEAVLNVAEQNLSYTKIYSPITGVVLNRNVSAGQTIASSFNAPVLFVIAKDLTKMQVNANVDEADIGGIAGGLNVTFTVDAFPSDIFRGIVQKIYLHPAVSANVVTYTTLISVDNEDLRLKPGMTASINIYLEEDSNALLIPSKALSFKPDSTQLKSYVILKGDKMKERGGDSTGRRKRIDSLQAGNPAEPNMKFGSVWVKSGDTLTRRRIVIGMNDDTNVKVISGLTIHDDVVTGLENAATKKSGSPSQQSQSPFMPRVQRPTNRPGTNK